MADVVASDILGFTVLYASGQRRQIKRCMADILRTGEYDVMDPSLQVRLMNLLAVISDASCAMGID